MCGPLNNPHFAIAEGKEPTRGVDPFTQELKLARAVIDRGDDQYYF